MKEQNTLSFREMILAERIEMIARDIQINPEEETDYHHGEELIDKLADEDRATLERYLEILSDHDAKVQEAVYRGGFRDGVCLAAELLMIVFSDM